MSRHMRHIRLILAVLLLAITGVAVSHSVLAAPATGPLAPAAPSPDVCTWFDCKIAAVSYSQDDAANINPTAPGTNSCEVPLEQAGLRGTFFYEGTTSQSWLALLTGAGHEVGSHLANHDLNCSLPPACAPNCTPQSLMQLPYTTADVNSFRQNQLDPNISAIESATGRPAVSMAYACGNTDPGRMAAAQYYFAGARGYYDPYGSNLYWLYDINTATPANMSNLNADTYFSLTLVARAVNEGGWEIVTVHDNCAGISVLRDISNTVWIAPIGDVLKYIRVRNAAQFTNYVRAGYNISFDAVHTLPTFQRQQLDGTALLPIVYDNAVTIRTPIATAASVVNLQVNGSAVPYTVGVISGTKYVWFNTPLNTSQHVNIQLDTPTAVKLASLQAASTSTDMTAVWPVLIAGGGLGVYLLITWKRRGN